MKNNFEKSLPNAFKKTSSKPIKKVQEKTISNVQNVLETEADRRVAESYIDLMLLQNYEYYNEGQNGVIGKIHLHKMHKEAEMLFQAIKKDHPELSLEFFQKTFLKKFEVESVESIPEEMAMKMLKIFSVDAGKAEAYYQNIAEELIRTAQKKHPDKKFAIVPHLYFHGKIEIPESLIGKLTKDRVNVINNKVYILVMDLIPQADDFQTKLYKTILERNGYDTKELASFSFSQLEREVGPFIGGWDRPGGKSGNIGERLYEAKKVEQANAEKVVLYLQKNGLHLDKTYLEQIQNTLDVWHENGFYHRDLHERNLMFQEKQKQSYIIDYGTATEASSAEIAYTDSDEAVYTDDQYLLRRCRKLSQTKEDRQIIEINNFFQDLFQPLKSLVLNKKQVFEKFLSDIQTIIHESNEPEWRLEDTQAVVENFVDRFSGTDRLFGWKLKAGIWMFLFNKFPNVFGTTLDEVLKTSAKDSLAMKNYQKYFWDQKKKAPEIQFPEALSSFIINF